MILLRILISFSSEFVGPSLVSVLGLELRTDPGPEPVEFLFPSEYCEIISMDYALGFLLRVTDHTSVARLPDVAKYVMSSTLQKDADQESLKGLESNEKTIDRVARPQEAEIGSVTAHGLDGSTQSLSSVAAGKEQKTYYPVPYTHLTLQT